MNRQKRRRIELVSIGILTIFSVLAPRAFSAQTAPDQVDPFYMKLLQSGEQYYRAQRYIEAAKALDVASFGLIPNPQLMAKALGYMSLSYFNLKDDARAKDSLVRIIDLVGLAGLQSLDLDEADRTHLIEIASFYKLDQPASSVVGPARTDTLGSSRAGAPAAKTAAAADRVAALEAMIKAQPKNVQAYLDLYDYRKQQKDMKGARRVLENLADKVPADPTGSFLLGKMDYAEKDYKACAEHLERTLSLRKGAPAGDKDCAEAESYLILAYNSLNKKPQLEKICRDFLARFTPNSVQATDLTEKDKDLALSILSTFQKNAAPTEGTIAPPAATPEESAAAASNAAAFKREIKKNPKDISLYYGLYDLYRQKKDWPAAQQALENLIKNNPNEAKACLALGRILYGNKDYGKAARTLGKIFSLPANVQVEESLRAEGAFYLALSQVQDKDRQAAMETYAVHRQVLQAFLSSGPPLSDEDAIVWRNLSLDGEAAGQVYLTGVRVIKSSSGLEVKIDLSRPTTYRTFVLPKERSLVVEVFQVTASKAPERIDVDSLGVKAIRCLIYQKDTVRVILDAQNRIPSNVVQKTDSGLSIIIGKSSAGI